MFNIDTFGSILPMALRETTIKIAKTRKLPRKIHLMMELNGLNPDMVNGFATHYSNNEESDVEIYFVYSEEKIEFAMMHDLIRRKHVFLIFPNYIVSNSENSAIYNIMGRIIESIAFYSLPTVRGGDEYPHVKDVYNENLHKRLLLYAVYNVWKAIDSFCCNDENVKIMGIDKDVLEAAMLEIDMHLMEKF